MRRLGTHKVASPNKAPCLVVVVYNALDGLPKFIMTQEGMNDIPFLTLNGTLLYCYNVLNDVTITSTRPQSGGGMVRTTVSLDFNSNSKKNYPFLLEPLLAPLYYGGANFDNFFFFIYSFDRSNLFEDLRKACCYGAFKVDNDLAWTEETGLQTLNLIDALLAQTQIVGATAEVIPDFFFIYNPWYNANFFPKVYGQVPRIRTLNAFPSFSVKKLSSSITGILRSNYSNLDGAGTVLVLEADVTANGSQLLQLVAIGGTARFRFQNGEVMSGVLTHDIGTDEIWFTITTRNTYYSQVGAWMDSGDGKSPDQWPGHPPGPIGAGPSYSTVQYNQTQTVIPNAKDVVLDANGFMQADINFYDSTAFHNNAHVTDVVTRIKGLLSERKDTVIHDPWLKPGSTGIPNTSISAFYDSNSNSVYLPSGIIPVWGVTSFEFLKFFTAPQNVRLFFIDPATALASGTIGDSWQLVNFEPTVVDTSCYLRNGYSHFDVNHVFVEGEGRLIQVPPANIVSITDDATFYGLTNLAKIQLTAAPLDMGIGAKSNIVYVDALYRTGTNDARSEKILLRFLQEEASYWSTLAGSNLTWSGYATVPDNYLPYIGIYIKDTQTVSALLDKIVYQLGIIFNWDYGQFDLYRSSITFHSYAIENITIDHVPTDFIKPLIMATDENEMIENSCGLKISKLQSRVENGIERVSVYYSASFGGWEDPYYQPIRLDAGRNVQPWQRPVQYSFDLINDSTSFISAAYASLSIGHASGYTLAQRRLICQMSMDGVRWCAMDPIIFKRFPLVSTVPDSNAIYDADDNILYPKPAGDAYYLMGALCVIDEIVYRFNIDKPTVEVTARNSQLHTTTNIGGGGGGLPGGVPPAPPTNPSLPPTTVGGLGGFGYGGTSMLMPLIVTAGEIEISTDSDYAEDVSVTVDAGWIFDLGFTYQCVIIDELDLNIDEESTIGASIIGSTIGGFPNKVSDAYVPAVFNIALHVNYMWFNSSSSGEFRRDLKLRFYRFFHVTRDPSSDMDHDFIDKKIIIRRKPLANVAAS